MNKSFRWILVALILALATPLSADQDAVAAYRAAAAEASAAFATVTSYQGEISLREQIKGKLRKAENVSFVIERKPVRLLFKWNKGAFGGMIVSHVASRDGAANMLALGHGIQRAAGVTKLGFDSVIIDRLSPHHYRINQYQLEFLLDRFNAVFEKGVAAGTISFTDRGVQTRPTGLKLHVFDVAFSDDAAHGEEFRAARIGFDTVTKLPLMIELTDSKDRLYAAYEVKKIVLNAPVDPSIYKIR
jgi:outer membrane lipoprotein-sorting protein